MRSALEHVVIALLIEPLRPKAYIASAFRLVGAAGRCNRLPGLGRQHARHVDDRQLQLGGADELAPGVLSEAVPGAQRGGLGVGRPLLAKGSKGKEIQVKASQ